MSTTNKVLGALLIGAAAGAVLGILFAPDKGELTRKKWMDSANDLADDLKQKIKDSKNLVSEYTNKLVSSSEEMLYKAKHEAENYANKAKDEAGRVAQQAKNNIHQS